MAAAALTCALSGCSACRGGSISLQQEGPLTAQGGFTLRMQRQWQGRQHQQQTWGQSRYPVETDLFFQPRGEGAVNGGSDGGGGGMPSVTHFVPPGLVCLEMPVGGSSRVSMLFYAVPIR